MKIIIALLSLTLLSGCALLNPTPFAQLHYNNTYLHGELIEHEKPYILDLGDEKIIVKTKWEHTQEYKVIHISDTYYRYVDGKLQEIEVEELEKK